MPAGRETSPRAVHPRRSADRRSSGIFHLAHQIALNLSLVRAASSHPQPRAIYLLGTYQNRSVPRHFISLKPDVAFA